MNRTMSINNLWRVRGIDETGQIRRTRMFAQGTAAGRYTMKLVGSGYIVRLERANDVQFNLLGVADVAPPSPAKPQQNERTAP